MIYGAPPLIQQLVGPILSIIKSPFKENQVLCSLAPSTCLLQMSKQEGCLLQMSKHEGGEGSFTSGWMKTIPTDWRCSFKLHLHSSAGPQML